MKKYTIILLSIILLLFGTIWIKYSFLKKTKEIPFCNLTEFSTAPYYVYCNITFKKTKYVIICTNTKLRDQFLVGKMKVFSPFYSLWLKEVIRHNWTIKVNSQKFSELKRGIVKKEFLEKHERNDTRKKVVLKGDLPDNLSINDFNAIVYLLLKNGINCRTYCESGGVQVIIPRHMIKKIDWEDFNRDSTPPDRRSL